MVMEKYELKFKVCRDNEAKEAGNFHEVMVTVLASEEATKKYMKKAAAVWIQGQIRSNWDAFLKDGVPGEVTLDDAIWGSTRGKMTVEKATEKLAALDPKARFKAMLDGGLITQDQYDALTM
jgi:hypothetical protein